MSVQAISWVINNSKNKGSSFVVLLMIANHAHADGTGAFPSFETLARESRITIRQVTNIIPVLERSGELFIEHGKGPNGSNLYTVRMTQLNLGMEKISNGKTRARISNEPSLTVLYNRKTSHQINESKNGNGPSDKGINLMIRHQREYLEYCKLRDQGKLPAGVKTWTDYQAFLDGERTGWRDESDKAQGWTVN